MSEPTDDGFRLRDLVPPGSWLATVDRDSTLSIVATINIACSGMQYVKNRLLIGVDRAGEILAEPAVRADTTPETAQSALEDLVRLRRLLGVIIARVAAAAIAAGVPREDADRWADVDNDYLVEAQVEEELHALLEFGRRIEEAGGSEHSTEVYAAREDKGKHASDCEP